MFSSAEKTSRPAHVHRQAKAGTEGSFLHAKGEDGFFSAPTPEAGFFSVGAGQNFASPGYPATAGGVQAKLSVSQPGDKHEQEADAMATQVMTMADPAPVAAAVPLSGGGGSATDGEHGEETVHRTAEEKKEETVHRAAEEKKEERVHAKLWLKVQRKEDDKKEKDCSCQESHLPKLIAIDREAISESTGAMIHSHNRGPPSGSPSFENTLYGTKGSGSSLPGSTLQFMEGRFGVDFSGVRIHTDSTAVGLSKDIHAQAFTHGSDIYFNAGKFAPHTSDGGFLLAHELTHTIQQGAVSRKVMTKPAETGGDSVMPKKLRPFKSLSELQRELPGAQRMAEEMEETGGEEETLHRSAELTEGAGGQPGLSDYAVTATGELTRAAAGDRAEVGRTADDRMVGGMVAGPVANVQAKETTKDTGQEEKESPDPEKEFMMGPARAGPGVMGPAMSMAGPGTVQRSLWGDIVGAVGSLGDLVSKGLEAGKRLLLDQAKEVVSHLPGYKALGVVLGSDPITGEHIDRNGHNFIEAAFDIIPGGELLHQKLTELGALTDAERWVDEQIATVENLVSNVRNQVTNFINSISLDSLAHPQDLLERAGNIIKGVLTSVVDFAVRAGSELLSTVKRFLLTQIVNFIKTQTTAYPLLRVVLGKDPITDEQVERNGTNILNAILELSEEGQEQRRQMQDTGTFQKVAAWIDKGIAIFHGAYEEIIAGFHQIWDLVSIQSLMDPIGTFRQIYNIFAPPVGRVLSYMAETALMILKFIKEVLMRRLAEYAKTVRGYPLVRVILGKDPFTDEQVPRNVENIIHGFMSLMDGGEEQFQQMVQTGAIARTQARIDAAVARLNMTPAYIVGLFRDLWNSFHIADLASPIETFRRIMAKFGEPIGRLIAFVVEIVRIIIDVILQVMNFPTNLIVNIIAKTQQAFEMIKADPIGFLKNLLRAIKQGFTQFFDKILKYLLDGLVAWLLSELKDANVKAPEDFTLKGIIGWVLTVLGITMEKIWERLAKHPKIGPEKVAKIRSMINTLEGIWTFIKDVQERGVAAIWDKIKEQLSNLWDTVLNAIKDWIVNQIINKMVTKLLSMLDPTGIMAVVNSAIALYKAIQSFLKYLREMLEVVNSFVEGVVEIASGNITVAANYLERTLGRAVPIVIGFLANQVGLSGIGKRVGELIEAARAMVEKAMDWLIDKAVTIGGKLLEMGKSAVLGWLGVKQPFKDTKGEDHNLSTTGNGKELQVASGTPRPVRAFLAQVDVAGDKDLSAARGRVQTKLVEMDGHLAWMAAPPAGATDADKQTKGKLIEDLAKDISGDLASLMSLAAGKEFPKTTSPQYDGLIGGFWGRGMRVQMFKTPPAGGSGTGGGNASWAQLRKRRNGGTTYYVQGHLLNEKLGGPGTNSANLTPITGSVNGNHEATAELYVKSRLTLASGPPAKANTVEAGYLILYNVIPAYGRPLNTTLINRIQAIPTGPASVAGAPPTQLSASDKADLVNIVTHEQYVPTALGYSITVQDPDSGQVKSDLSRSGEKIDNEIDQSSYSLDSGTYVF